ncbi:MAG: hypothetical protein OHK0039_34370 [Bacteroidia bacterium]
MSSFIAVFVLLPFVGYNASLLIPARRESLLSWVSFGTVGLQLHLAVGFWIFWLIQGHEPVNIKEIVLYRSGDYEFFIDFYFDHITAVYLLAGSLLSFLVTIYSRYYMHREAGFKRFFNTVLFFFLGYNLTIFAGNFETLFLGWELLGISSFLLIAFYRERYLPVKNAVKVFSVYRIGDVGILLAMWMSHHLWHENITFLKLGNEALVSSQLQHHSLTGVFISLMILLSAAAKSAQLPFSSWLPRAMEGPTPSSAIFYGSLSVHMGVFLLLRTYPFWEHQSSVRIAIALLGAATSIITTGIARVQSSIKSQIAYASVAQIGLMFIEISLGFTDLVLLHFAGNAFLRTYQLLVSPSVVSYLIRAQLYADAGGTGSVEDRFPRRLAYTLYILCLKEWNLDAALYRLLWRPLKWLGNRLDFLNLNRLILYVVPGLLAGLVLWVYQDSIPAPVRRHLPVLFALIGLVSVLKSFVERRKVRMSWLLILLNHYWVALGIAFNERVTLVHVLLYLGGITASGVVGMLCLNWLKRHERLIDLDRFHGHAYSYPRTAFLFLAACLGMTGFPITTTFLGEDLMFAHIHAHQVVLAAMVALSFIVDGLAAIRIYARVFLGPHTTTYHPVAYRSS